MLDFAARSGTLPMSLSPEAVADILVRQQVLTSEQAAEVHKEARSLPRRARNPRASEGLSGAGLGEETSASPNDIERKTISGEALMPR